MKRKRVQRSPGFQGLMNILEPYEGYWKEDKSDGDDEAKDALIEFFEKYKNIKTDKSFDLNGWDGYFDFYYQLLPVRQALAKGWYANACEGILTLNAYQVLSQKRIYDAMMDLYHKYLEESDGERKD